MSSILFFLWLYNVYNEIKSLKSHSLCCIYSTLLPITLTNHNNMVCFGVFLIHILVSPSFGIVITPVFAQSKKGSCFITVEDEQQPT